MSGSDSEDLAGLYVLGALNAEEMRAVRTDADRDPAVAAAIVDWERRLTPLVALVPAAILPDTLWPQLEARLSRLSLPGQARGETYIPPLRQRTRRRDERRAVTAWRAVALGAMALAASLAIILITRQTAAPVRTAMIMPAQPGLGGWLVALLPNGEIRATAQGALSHSLQQDYELWALAEGATKPVPLGLLPLNNVAQFKPVSTLPGQKFQLLVSLEQKGGSPTGLPTLPVLFASPTIIK